MTPDSPQSQFKLYEAHTLMHRANVALGRTVQAQEHRDAAAKLLADVLKCTPENDADRRLFASDLIAVARVLRDAQDVAELASELEDALAIARRAADIAKAADQEAAALDILADARFRSGDLAGAVKTQGDAIQADPKGENTQRAERLARYEAALKKQRHDAGAGSP